MSGTDTRLPLADTGWILPTLATDITVLGTFDHKGYRRIGKICYLSLSLTVANTAIDKLLFTLPVGFRVTGATKSFSGGLSGGARIYPNGEIRLNTAATAMIGEASFVIEA